MWGAHKGTPLFWKIFGEQSNEINLDFALDKRGGL